MTNESFTIGTLARRGGVNVETVRYYQRRGLLPFPVRPPGGVRRYSDESVRRLRFIKRAQQLGFTLAEVAELLTLAGSAGCSPTCAVGERRLADIERKIQSLVSVRDALAQLVLGCRDSADGCSPCPIIEALVSSPPSRSHLHAAAAAFSAECCEPSLKHIVRDGARNPA